MTGYRPDGPIVLAAHDSTWAISFDQEAVRVQHALESCFVAIHHIGSTAIPDIVAKPVIDMLAVVDRVEALDIGPSRLEPLGYEGLGEFGIPGRRYFRRNSPEGFRTHQIHAFGRDSAEIQRHLDFRDYLRAHPVTARAYDTLKRRLAAEHPGQIGAYTDAKTDFIREVERLAAAWRGHPRAIRPTHSLSHDSTE
jgi:GrpB-like predicted nucleotidyltransferase (UPF0157 family)